MHFGSFENLTINNLNDVGAVHVTRLKQNLHLKLFDVTDQLVFKNLWKIHLSGAETIKNYFGHFV